MRMVQPGAEAAEVHGMRAVASKGVLPGHAPIGGSVCMDMCMVDVTDIPCHLGDLAYLFNARHPVSEVARDLGTIPYEVLTGIAQRVKRVHVQG